MQTAQFSPGPAKPSAGPSGPVRRGLALLALGVLAAPAAALAQAGAADAGSLSLERALALAETANLSIKLSREAAQQAAAAEGQAAVAVLPSVALRGTQQRSETVSITNGVPVQSVPGNRFDGKLAGAMTVLNLQQRSTLRAAKAGVEVAGLDVQASIQSSLSSVGQAYFTHLRNLRRIDVFSANVERAKALLTLAKNQAAAGVATQIDVTRAEAQLAQAVQARLQQQTVVFGSEISLLRLLDLPAEQSLTLAGFNVKRELPAAVASETTARARRPEYLRAEKAVEQSRLEARAARAGRLPTVGVVGEYGTVSPVVGDRDRETAWLAAATLSMPLFDGWKTRSDLQLALSRQRAQELRKRQVEQLIATELRFAREDAASRLAQIGVAETSLRLADEELRLARSRYEQGVADNREMVEAQNRLAVADDGLVEAVYQYNLARLELSRVEGDVRAILGEKSG